MPRSYDDELHALRHQVESLTLLREIAVAANEATVYTDAISVALDRICAHIEWPVGHAYVPAHDDPDGKQKAQIAPLPAVASLGGSIETEVRPTIRSPQA